MTKYIIKEKAYIDTFLGKLFLGIARGIQTNVEKDVVKKDPVGGKKLQQLRKQRDDIERHLKKQAK